MKNILSTIIILTLVSALSACGGTNPQNEASNKVVSSTQSAEPAKVTDASDDDSSSVETQETPSNITWKQFLKEYEAWVDKYIEINQKYQANPTDASILSDYTEMMSELTEWTNKISEMQKELEKASLDELAEYSAEIERISAKIK